MAHHGVLLLVLGCLPSSLCQPPPPDPTKPPRDPGFQGCIYKNRAYDACSSMGQLSIYIDNRFNAWDRYGWMLINLLPLAIFALIGFRYVYLLRHKTEKLELEYSKNIQKGSDPLFSLVNLMTPTLELDDYKFKGIQKTEHEINLRFDNLGLELHDGRTVLAGVTGSFEAGRLVAIMGASGAGKTTFMNVLCGKGTYGKMSGDVKVNGEVQDIKELKSIMGFVPQEDVVHEKLTVRENIRYSACLRNPRHTKQSVINDIVNDVLTVLQIGHIQMSIVGGVEERGISGGQRKRVNIGLELAATPQLLFLDEPTTGLDSTSSLSIVTSLKKMSELGMTIIMVIHQPRYSLFTLFDTVLLLGKGGKTVYLGEPWDAPDYFIDLGFPMPEDDNPADWLMDVLSGEVPNEKEPDKKMPLSKLIDLWEAHNKKALTEGTPSSRRSKSVCTEPVTTALQGIAGALEEAWANCQVGVALDRDELSVLVKYCTGVKQPGESIVEQLWMHIKGVCGEDKTEFTFTEVVDALEAVRARHDAAHEKATPRKEPDGLSSMVDRISQACDNVGDAIIASPTFFKPSPRLIPGIVLQYRFLSQRLMVQLFRNMPRRIMDISVIIGAALVLGLQHNGKTGHTRKSGDEQNIILFHLALSMLIPVNCLSCLGSARTMFWRERSHGLLGVSYCFACMVVNSIDIFLQSLVYVTVYYLAARPDLPFQYLMEAILCLAFVCSGWGYLISCLVPPSSATLAVSALMLILNGCFADPVRAKDYIDGGFMEFVVALCPSRWTMQMMLISWYDVFNIDPPAIGEGDVMLVNRYRKSAFDQGQDITRLGPKEAAEKTTLSEIGDTYWNSAVTMLCLQAVVLRLLTIPLLCYRNRDKQV